MPHLFSLPNWLILIPLLTFIHALKGEEQARPTAVAMFFCLVGFDQFNFVTMGSVIEPVKAIILVTLLVTTLRFTIPRIGTAEKLFLFWLMFRDLISFFSLHGDALFAARYSLQLYVMYYGIFVTAALLLLLYSPDTLMETALRGICLAVFVSAVIAGYQYAAFHYGLPLNGIRNAYTEAQGGALKWAAYSLNNLVQIRPYAFMGEPKFLGGFAVISYAFLLFAYFQDLVSRRTLAVQTLLVVVIILLTASTSAMVSFALVNLTLLLSVRRGWLILASLALLVLGGGYVLSSVYGWDATSFIATRLTERLFGAESALEEHELDFMKRLLSSPENLIFGLGHSVFADTAYKGFRTIPNGLLVYFGVNGGLILILFYLMTILKSLRHARVMSIFVAAGLVYTTMTTYFVLFLLSSIAYNYHTSTVAESEREEAGWYPLGLHQAG